LEIKGNEYEITEKRHAMELMSCISQSRDATEQAIEHFVENNISNPGSPLLVVEQQLSPPDNLLLEEAETALHLKSLFRSLSRANSKPVTMNRGTQYDVSSSLLSIPISDSGKQQPQPLLSPVSEISRRSKDKSPVITSTLPPAGNTMTSLKQQPVSVSFNANHAVAPTSPYQRRALLSQVWNLLAILNLYFSEKELVVAFAWSVVFFN
jgi:hypothetical protein